MPKVDPVALQLLSEISKPADSVSMVKKVLIRGSFWGRREISLNHHPQSNQFRPPEQLEAHVAQEIQL